MSTVAGGAALVGRVEELNHLRSCCRAVASGTGALVLLDGEAGAGKTRLLSEAVKAPFLPRGFASAVAGALDYAPAPYAPIRDLILALDKRFPKVLAGNRELCAALQPVLEFRPLEGHAGPAEQRRVLDAVVEAMTLFAAQAPIVLALEDAHWIDRASADVLVHLARSIPGIRAMLLVSFRPAEAHEDESVRNLLGQLSRSAALSLSLKPLSAADAMLLIDDAAPASLAMEVRRQICRLAEGNPLLLLEFTKVAIENPAALGGPLSITLKALVAERLAHFDAVDVDVLRVAAVMGEFDPRVLAEIAGIAEDRVFATLRKARNASIVGEKRAAGAPFVFRHALIRHAITDDLLSYESEQLHRRIAERLESQPESPQLHSRLARHYYHAKAVEKSRHYNEIAAGEALAVLAFSDASQLLERAIDGRALDQTTYSMYKRLADAYADANRPADSIRVTQMLFDFAVSRADGREAADLGFELSRRRYQLLDDDGSVETIRSALAVVDADEHPDKAFNLRATLAWYCAQLRRTDEAAEAIAAAEMLLSHGDRDGLVRYHEARAVYKVHSGDKESYRGDLEAAISIAETRDPLFFIRRLDTAIAISMASNLDDMEFAVSQGRRLLSVAQSQPAHVLGNLVGVTANVLFLAGDLETARAALTTLFSAAEEAPLVSFALARTGIPLALQLDDPLLLRRCSRPRLLESAFASNTANVFGQIAAAVSEQLRSQGRAGEAAALVGQAMKRLKDAANNVALVIEAARLGPSEALDRGLAMLDEIRSDSRSAEGGRHLSTAYVSTGAERRDRALRAAELFGSISWALYEAEALELAGETRSALDIYRRCGAIAGIRRLEQTQNARSNSGLSKREWEVAQLVAQGKSNRAIGTELYLSERTVENHVASIFAKLSLRSRAEIAAHIARESAQAGQNG